MENEGDFSPSLIDISEFDLFVEISLQIKVLFRIFLLPIDDFVLFTATLSTTVQCYI